MTGIILAAGCGKRLKINKPKGMLTIGGNPLNKYSLNSLESSGITKVIIVTGYESSKYERYLSTLEMDIDIHCINNPNFYNSGSLYSLDLALSYIKEQKLFDDLVIMDSDIIFNMDEFTDFINNNNHRNAIMASNVFNGRYDACYAEIDSDGDLVKISKDVTQITTHDSIYWEHIGIIKSSRESIQALINYSTKLFNGSDSINHEYDYAFENLNMKYKIIKYQDYIWTEVDDNDQLKYLVTNIYPKLNLLY